MERKTKRNLKNMMINNIFILVALLISVKGVSQQRIVNDFNLDNVKDTLFYKCEKISEFQGQPFCKGEIKISNSKNKYPIKLYYVNSPVIDACGDGCVSIFDDAGDTEYLQEYTYNRKYDDWILTKDEKLLKYKNNKTINTLSKTYLLGLSGKKYLVSKRRKHIVR